MEKMKKVIISIITLLIIIFGLSFSLKVTAIESDNGLASYDVLKTYKNTNFTYTNHQSVSGYTLTKSGSFNQNVNVFTQKQTDNSKVVTWAVSTGSGFARKKLTEIAADYEKNHPGWEVIGGINADQYIQVYGTSGVINGSDVFCPQPYYPMIADGDSWFSIPCWPVSGGGNIAAFIQGGVSDSIVNGSMNFSSGDVKIAGLFLSIYDDNENIIKKFAIEKVNEKPNDGESSIWIGYVLDNKVKEIDIEGKNLFVVSQAIQAYMSNSDEYADWKNKNATNALFAKGIIDSRVTSAKILKGAFAIDTTNQELLDCLDIGIKVRIQYEYEGIYNEVESAVGYHTIQRMDNKDLNSSASYNTKQYARSLFGRKSNGDIVLITVDMGSESAKGSSHNETNAILKYYGCVEAYQMDGGGSVGAIIKENDEFFYINQNTEERAIFSGLLLVERKKPEYNVELVDVAEKTAKFKVDLINDYNYEINNIYIEVNDKKYNIVNGEVIITGLRKNKDYNWFLCFEDNNGIKIKTKYKGQFSTICDIPYYTECIIEEESGKLILKFDFYDKGKALTEYSIIVGDNKETVEVNDGKYESITISATDEDIVLEYIYISGLNKEQIRVVNPHFESSKALTQLNVKQKQILQKFFK